MRRATWVSVSRSARPRPRASTAAGAAARPRSKSLLVRITIYNPDGTASDDGTVDVGDSVPMTVRLTSPAAVDGQFMLSYDTNCFKITTDAAGNNVVLPDTTTIHGQHRRHAALPLGRRLDHRPGRLANHVGVRRRRPAGSARCQGEPKSGSDAPAKRSLCVRGLLRVAHPHDC